MDAKIAGMAAVALDDWTDREVTRVAAQRRLLVWLGKVAVAVAIDVVVLVVNHKPGAGPGLLAEYEKAVARLSLIGWFLADDARNGGQLGRRRGEAPGGQSEQQNGREHGDLPYGSRIPQNAGFRCLH